ncbi:MAG: VOC family protein [Alphaproteobacteria bacterium]|nr:VOC family protein [Alphaproteobacteria bacterium]
MNIRNALAGIAVSDLDRSLAWYAGLIGRPPDERPLPGLVEWSFSRGGWVHLFCDPARAGACTVTLVESDLAERQNDLRAKGIAVLSASETDDVRLLVVADPDGNQIVLAEGLTPRHRATAPGPRLVFLPFGDAAGGKS